MDISLKSKGSFTKSKMYFANAKIASKINNKKVIKIVEETIEKLIEASPYESIAKCWSYEIEQNKRGLKIYINNSYVENGANIALIVDVGHGTSNGKWVSGKNYIKEPIQEAYDKILKEAEEEFKSL